MKNKFMLRITGLTILLLVLSSCGGGGGGDRTGGISTCEWGLSNWESGCNWAK